MNFKFELGLQAKDIITGTEGVLVGRCQYLFGCNQYGIAPRVLKDGKRLDTEWFDEGRIIISGDGIKAESVTVELPGPDRNKDCPK